MFSNEAFAQNAEKYMDTVFRVGPVKIYAQIYLQAPAE